MIYKNQNLKFFFQINGMYTLLFSFIVSWKPQPEGWLVCSMMFHWEPEGCSRHKLCITIASFWLSMEHHGMVIRPFWLSTDMYDLKEEYNKIDID